MAPTRKPVHHIGLVVKHGNAAGAAQCDVVEAWLAKRAVQITRITHPEERFSQEALASLSLIVVFAGDGTLVSVSRQLMGKGIPITGVNFGQVGFLAELDETLWEKALTSALDEGVQLEPRMSLHYSLSRKGKCIRSGEVVNDVVVTRGKVARLVRLHLCINGTPFVNLRSDGLIFSTPTGSSGYAGSAGGPLVQPVLDAYIVAAICPYLSNFPPLALGYATRFSAVVGEAAPDLFLTLDGQEAYPLKEGDILEVYGLPGRFLMADFGLKNYFERLRRLGFVQTPDTRAD